MRPAAWRHGRISRLLAIFDKPELDFRKNRAECDDLQADAYSFQKAMMQELLTGRVRLI